jgi:two-component system OmpR family sensor kinase
LAIFGVIAIFFTFANHQMQKDMQNAEQFARYAIHSSYDIKNSKINYKNLKSLGLSVVRNKKIRKKIFSRSTFFKSYQKPPSMMQGMMGGMMRGMAGINTRAIVYDKNIYVILKKKNAKTIILLTPFKKEIFPSILSPIMSILFVIFLYIVTVKNILPLYTLRKKIKLFADGDYEIDCKSKNKDEIGILANEFDEAVKKIKNLRDSRQLFLRNIMHELKTPIAKGRFAIEITQDTNLKKALQSIFGRQEYLIEEFARIEKLNANELKIDKKEYLLEDIVDFSLDILNHDKSQVLKDISKVKLSVDFELFGTALKNLLDNGINYSSDSKVKILNKNDEIIISNNGDKLEFPLENYAKPYSLKGQKQKSSRGLGFGLYIVLHVLKLHDMSMEYKREGEVNLFIIKNI